MNLLQSQFLEHWREAEERAKENKLEGIALYRRLLSIQFTPDLDSWNDYYTAKIELGVNLMEMYEFVESRSLLKGVLAEMEQKSADSKLTPKKKYRIRYSCFHNLAKLQLRFSYKFSAAEYYQSYRQAMNASYGHFKAAVDLVVEYMIKYIWEDEQEIDAYWSDQYLKIKSNYLQLLFQEGQQFNQLAYFKLILQQVAKAKRFNGLLDSNRSEIHLYRCYYYQSTSFRALGEIEQAYQLLQEDYRFQMDHNELDDAAKSRKELLRICLDNNMMKDVNKYVDANNRAVVDSLIQRRERLKFHFTNQEQLKRSNKRTYQQLFQQFDDEYNIYRHDLVLMDRYIQSSLSFYRSQPSIKAFLYYYLAETNYRLANYQKAAEMIAQAIKISTNDEIELRDWKIEEFMIKCKYFTERAAVHRKYQALLDEINRKMRSERRQDMLEPLEKQKQNLIKCYSEFKKFQVKAQDSTFYNFDSAHQNTLLTMMEQHRKNKEQRRNAPRRHSVVSESEDFISKSDELMPRSKKTVFNPEEDYARKCSESGVPARAEIKQNILRQNNSFNPLTDVLNMSTQELLIILPLLRVAEIDLRNHTVNDEVLAAVSEMPHRSLVRSFKVSGINQPAFKCLLETIGKMGELSQLSFSNFVSLKPSPFHLLDKHQLKNKEMDEQVQPEARSLVHMLVLLKYVPSQLNLASIKVLKLKYCNLVDAHLKQLDFQHFPSLQKLSLSNNLLEGTELQAALSLPRLNSLSLSDNPLLTLAFQAWKGRFFDEGFQLKSLKLRGIHFTSALAKEVSLVLQRVQSIDLSECRFLSNLLAELWNGILQGELNLNRLRAWIMKRVEVDFTADRLAKILNSCESLLKADLRLCDWKYEQSFKEELSRVHVNELLISQSQSMSGFSLE